MTYFVQLPGPIPLMCVR